MSLSDWKYTILHFHSRTELAKPPPPPEGTVHPFHLHIRYPTKAMNEATAESLKKYLQTVITEGTGAAALPKTVTAAGKTATAQTGKFENGKEILSSWFCGFFPADKPKYIFKPTNRILR